VIRSEVQTMIDKMMTSSLHPFRGKLEELASYYESILEKKWTDLEHENFILGKRIIKMIAEREQEDLHSAVTQLAFRVKKLEEWASS
jgi:hypothetical protein